MGRGYLKRAFQELDEANKSLSKQRSQAQLSWQIKHNTSFEEELLKIHRNHNKGAADKNLCNLVNMRKSLLFHPLVQTRIEKAIRDEILVGSSKFLKKLGEAIKTPSKRMKKGHLGPLNNYLFKREVLKFGFDIDFNDDQSANDLRKKMRDELDEELEESDPLLILLYNKQRFFEHLVRLGLRNKKRKRMIPA